MSKAQTNTKDDNTQKRVRGDVEVVNLTFLKEKGIAIGTVKYGEMYLKNITVAEKNHEPAVLYPEKKGYPVYKFSDKDGYDRDKQTIESALKQHYADMKSGKLDAVKDSPIPGVQFKRDYSPRIYGEREFEGGDKSMTVGYKGLMVNNVGVRQTDKGVTYVAFPSYKKSNGEWDNHVTANREFKESIISACNEKFAEKDLSADRSADFDNAKREQAARQQAERE